MLFEFVLITMVFFTGSLGNTWRQGDWRSKYKLGPDIVPLLRPSTCKCEIQDESKCKTNERTYAMEIKGCNIPDEYRIERILPNDDEFIAEKFYDNSILNQVEIVDNLETQAQFVRELFENRICDENCDDFQNGLKFECEINEVRCNLNESGEMELIGCNVKESDVSEVSCECKVSEGRKCDVGCGCVCDECYSSCWPRDWIKEDYPEARVISINYTSDPYLWRPLWIKGCKR
jgi:hypothetical protein